jgi:nucleotide-binding universal stress UspA family protein
MKTNVLLVLRRGMPATAQVRAVICARPFGDRVGVLRADDLDRMGTIVARARDSSSALIVLAGFDERPGSAATILARAAGTAVLVARPLAADRAMVVATDLRRPELPVLTCAAGIARRLGLSVVALHNVTPIAFIIGGDLSMAVPIPPDELAIEVVLEHLFVAAGTMETAAESVLRHELDPATAILKEADARDAALIVVGTPHAAGRGRPATDAVAARVIDRTPRSVLVTPQAA